MTLKEFATELGVTISDINIVPLTGEEILAIEQAMVEANEEEDETIEREYEDYLESRYYAWECRGQY